MTDCEMCGNKNAKFKIMVEGATLTVCFNCSKYGKLLKKEKTDEFGQIIQTQEKKYVPREFREEKELIENFGKKVRELRESKNMTLEDFAKSINEMTSFIDRIENEKVTPDQKFADKIYKKYKLILFQEPKELTSTAYRKKKKEDVTLFDIYSIEKEKK